MRESMSFRTDGSARTLAGVVPAISQIRLMAETMSLRRVPVSPASVEETQHVRKRADGPIRVHGASLHGVLSRR